MDRQDGRARHHALVAGMSIILLGVAAWLVIVAVWIWALCKAAAMGDEMAARDVP